LTHITDGETTKRRVVSEGLNTHGLGWNHLDNGSITRLDELWGSFGRLSSTTVNLLEKLGELAGNVGSVAIKDWGVSGTDLTRMVEDNDLGVEGLGTLGGILLGVTADVSTANLLDGDVLDVESDIVTGDTLDKLLVMHLDGLDFGGDTSGGESDDHAGLDDTGLDTADWHCSNTANLVDVLKWQTEGLVGWAGWRLDGIDGLEEGLASDLGLDLLLPSLVPGAVGGGVNHVVTVEARNWHERHMLGVVTDLLDEVGGLLDDFLITGLGPLGSVHLVDGNDELLDTESVGKQGMLTGLAILGDTSLELTSTSSDNEDSAIGLGGTSDHVLDEVTMAGGIWGVLEGEK
jgi:hypothetical protein